MNSQTNDQKDRAGQTGTETKDAGEQQSNIQPQEGSHQTTSTPSEQGSTERSEDQYTERNKDGQHDIGSKGNI